MKIKLANYVIEVDHLYPYLEEYCKDYLVNEDDVDFYIRVDQSDIDFEREKSRQDDLKKGIEIRSFSDDYLESLAVYRKVAEWMPIHNVVLFHGSILALDHQGYLFTAKSGTGKSTHARLWQELFGDQVTMVNDDKPLLKVEKNEVLAYGTPWNGKHRLGTNICVPLKGISVLHRSLDNKIKRVSKQEIYEQLLGQIYLPHSKELMISTFSLLDAILDYVPVYALYCNKDIEAAKIAYNGMKG